MKKWVCTVCGWVYDEELGDQDYDLAPGVAFEDLPEDFVCPLCGVGKDHLKRSLIKFYKIKTLAQYCQVF